MTTHLQSNSFVRNLNQFRTEIQAKTYIELGVQAEAEGINALKGQRLAPVVNGPMIDTCSSY